MNSLRGERQRCQVCAHVKSHSRQTVRHPPHNLAAWRFEQLCFKSMHVPNASKMICDWPMHTSGLDAAWAAMLMGCIPAEAAAGLHGGRAAVTCTTGQPLGSLELRGWRGLLQGWQTDFSEPSHVLHDAPGGCLLQRTCGAAGRQSAAQGLQESHAEVGVLRQAQAELKQAQVSVFVRERYNRAVHCSGRRSDQHHM